MMVMRMPQLLIFPLLLNHIRRTVRQRKIRRPKDTDGRRERQLELKRHQPEIDNLHGRPEEIVRLEGRNVDVFEFVLELFLAAAFCYGLNYIRLVTLL